MAARRSGTSRRMLVGAALIVLGLVCCGLHRLSADDEQHSYAAGSVAPYFVTVTSGHTYSISVHNGVRAEADLGLDPASLACTRTAEGGQPVGLSVVPEQATTKAVNQIAAFVAPQTGRVHIGCTGISAVFIDDADDAAPDTAGFWLLLGVLALAIGLPLGLSALRAMQGERTAGAAADADRETKEAPLLDVVAAPGPAQTADPPEVRGRRPRPG